MAGKMIGELLLELGVIDAASLQQAIDEQQTSGESLGEIIIRRGMVSVDELENILARQHSVPAINLENYSISSELLLLVPEDYMRKHLVAPVAVQEKNITVAMANPGDYAVIDELRFMTGKQVSPVVTSRTGIRSLLDKTFPHLEKNAGKNQINEHPVDLTIPSTSVSKDLDSAVRSLATSQLDDSFQTLLATAAAQDVTHIHLQTGEGPFRIRFRVDADLGADHEAPVRAGEGILKRLKALCCLDENGKKISQGFFDAKLSGTHYRIGFNSIPLPGGESAVVSIEYPPIHAAPTLDVLGMYPEVLAAYHEMIGHKSGLILFPAPPGSGKTTTIYATLEELRSQNLRSVTVESPIRRHIDGVEQLDPTQLPGVEAEWLLQALSGQDIDHLMIRDISSPRALQSALRASRAGALVLGRADYHGALGFISNAITSGIDPTLLASELLGVVGQRLVNMLCSHCLESEEPTEKRMEELKRLTGRRTPTLYRATGCPRCRQTGKMGKVGVYELFPAGDRLTQMIVSRAGESRMKEILSASGARTLAADGLLKATDGLVSLEEVLAAV
jgi:type IV pilus assembly protein PilB